MQQRLGFLIKLLQTSNVATLLLNVNFIVILIVLLILLYLINLLINYINLYLIILLFNN